MGVAISYQPSAVSDESRADVGKTPKQKHSLLQGGLNATVLDFRELFVIN